MKSFVIDMCLFRARPLSSLIALIASCSIVVSASGASETTPSEAAKFLPDKIDAFQASGPASQSSEGISKRAKLADFGVISDASRLYSNEVGERFTVEVVRTENDASAYALLTRLAVGDEETKTGVMGIAAIVPLTHIVFCKGNTLVEIESNQSLVVAHERLVAISRGFAETLPSGDDDIPVLVEHLPNWQSAAGRASYAVTLNGLKTALKNQPILDTLDFEGGTEAVSANYGQSQLVIVEFTTPQISIDNDQRILAKIQELKNQGQSAPSAYRRVGNYSVFVFNASDEKTANELIDQVKYQQVVQWLGEDPHLYEKLQRYFANTSAGVLLAVMESSGLSLLVCLGLGALLGGLLFRHRRAQQSASYSDAGGTVRLNLDELTGTDSQKLLDSGTSPDSNSRAS